MGCLSLSRTISHSRVFRSHYFEPAPDHPVPQRAMPGVVASGPPGRPSGPNQVTATGSSAAGRGAGPPPVGMAQVGAKLEMMEWRE